MIDISLAGLIGAIVGTVIAALVYGTVVDAVEQWLTTHRPPEARAGEEIDLLRRGVLAVDIVLFAGLGYWVGQEIGG